LVCANVANLLLARGAARRREFGVRLALGASRVRLMRQLLTESAVLSLAAAMVALFLMNAAAGLLARVTVDGKSLGSLALGPDLRTVAFIALLALGSAVVFGLMPARQSLAIDLTPALRDGATGSGHKRSRLRSVLLASQVALSLVLLIGAGLFTRALQRALTMDPGFSPDHVAVTGVNPGLAHYDAARATTYYAQVSERLAGLKGITGFAWATSLPLSGDHDQESIDIPGYVAPNAKRLSVEVQFVSGGYFPVLRIPLRSGRTFDERDAPGAMHVAVVNETMARKFWPGRDAVGQRFMMLNDTMTIVGVARDVKYHELSEEPRPFVYLNAIQQLDKGSPGSILLIARTTGDPAAAAASLKAALLSADPHVVPFGMTTADAQLRDLLLPQRAGAMVLGGFSLLALIIALIGVHGVVSYAVSRRTREIGIRVALGARGDRVVRELVREHVPAIAGGLAVGLALAAAGTRAMASFLYGVSATDFTTFAGASLLMAAVALAAAAIPARRAAKVDPMTALRYE
jgi:predicted permease